MKPNIESAQVTLSQRIEYPVIAPEGNIFFCVDYLPLTYKNPIKTTEYWLIQVNLYMNLRCQN